MVHEVAYSEDVDIQDDCWWGLKECGGDLGGEKGESFSVEIGGEEGGLVCFGFLFVQGDGTDLMHLFGLFRKVGLFVDVFGFLCHHNPLIAFFHLFTIQYYY